VLNDVVSMKMTEQQRSHSQQESHLFLIKCDALPMKLGVMHLHLAPRADLTLCGGETAAQEVGVVLA
jgi:hypothetical protein